MAKKDDTKSYSDYRVNAVKTKEDPINEFHIYLTEVIQMESDMVALLQDIAALDRDDEIHIHINNYGGSVDMLIQMINAIKKSPCRVITYLEGIGASCASIVFLLGDERYVHKYSVLMLHYYSTLVWGKGQEVEADVGFYKTFLRKFFKDFYKELLTKEELRNLFKGEDFYLDARSIKKRLPDVMDIEWLR